MNFAPSEVEIFGAYVPPSLIAVVLGVAAMELTVRVLTPRRLARYLLFPEVVMLSMTVIYTIFISTFVVPA